MRFSCPCTAQRFPPGKLSKTARVLSFTSDDLAHALFATGRAPGDQAAHGASSVFEWLHRVAIIPAYLRSLGGGSLTRSPLAVELDRSEKVGLSYALGQAMASVFCVQYLGVTHLMHVDRYSRRFNLTFAAGTRQRPDLFGPGTGGWVVAEAKGRSNSMESALQAKMSAQKRTIRAINGAPPWVALGCVASFPPASGALRVDAFDPEEVKAEAVAIDADLDRFLLAYYEPFLAALDVGEQDPESTDRFESVRFPGAGLRVGLLRPIAQAVRSATGSAPDGLSASVFTALEDRPRDARTDGSFVEGDWDEALSLRSETSFL